MFENKVPKSSRPVPGNVLLFKRSPRSPTNSDRSASLSFELARSDWAPRLDSRFFPSLLIPFIQHPSNSFLPNPINRLNRVKLFFCGGRDRCACQGASSLNPFDDYKRGDDDEWRASRRSGEWQWVAPNQQLVRSTCELATEQWQFLWSQQNAGLCRTTGNLKTRSGYKEDHKWIFAPKVPSSDHTRSRPNFPDRWVPIKMRFSEI